MDADADAAAPAPDGPPLAPAPERPASRPRPAWVLVVAVVAAVVTGPAVVLLGSAVTADRSSPTASADADDAPAALPLDTLLPGADDYAGLTRSGMSDGQLAGTWTVNEDRALDEDDPPPACVPDVEPTGGHLRYFVLAGDDGGLFAESTVVVRRFSSAVAARTFVAAHAGDAFQACRSDRSRVATEGLDPDEIVEERIDPLPAFGDGTAIRYVATTRTGAAGCTSYQDTFWNAVGPYAISADFDSCSLPLDSGRTRQIIAGLIGALRGS